MWNCCWFVVNTSHNGAYAFWHYLIQCNAMQWNELHFRLSIAFWSKRVLIQIVHTLEKTNRQTDSSTDRQAGKSIQSEREAMIKRERRGEGKLIRKGINLTMCVGFM